jgi:hypothetical protein
MPRAASTVADLRLLPGQRSHARARLNLPARLVTFNATMACTLIDLSQTGAKLGARECPRVGALVVVEDLPIELFGTVRWTAHELFGIEFDVPLPLEPVVKLRRFADTADTRRRQAALTYARDWVQGTI